MYINPKGNQMTYGIIITTIIVWYFAMKYRWFAILGFLVSMVFTCGVLYLIWTVANPNNMWFFWIHVAIAAVYVFVVNTLGKAAHSIFD